MRFKDTEIPNWLQDRILLKNPEPDFNNIIEILLQDYIERKEPNSLEEKIKELEVRIKELKWGESQADKQIRFKDEYIGKLNDRIAELEKFNRRKK